MDFSRYERVKDYEVQCWLEKQLDLSPYQREKLRERELVRFAPFKFIKQRKAETVSPLWRLSIVFWPLYVLLLIIFSPLTYLIKGTWGYPEKFLQRFYYPWKRKLKI